MRLVPIDEENKHFQLQSNLIFFFTSLQLSRDRADRGGLTESSHKLSPFHSALRPTQIVPQGLSCPFLSSHFFLSLFFFLFDWIVDLNSRGMWFKLRFLKCTWLNHSGLAFVGNFERESITLRISLTLI